MNIQKKWEYLKELNSCIDVVGCFNTTDLMIRDKLEAELCVDYSKKHPITNEPSWVGNSVSCPLCITGTMWHRLLNKRTHVWSCEECPGFLMEYHDWCNLSDVGLDLRYKEECK